MMEELIKKIKEVSAKNGGLTIEEIADFETAVIEEAIKVEAVSELIREQKLIDPVSIEAIENADRGKEVIADVEGGVNDAALKNKYRKVDFQNASKILEVKPEKDTQQGHIEVIRKALEGRR